MHSQKQDGTTDYGSVTEQPGIKVTLEARAMLHTRYAYAASFCDGKDVLEVGCGAGMGVGLLAKRARLMVGGDCSDSLLRQARRHYGERIPFVRLDAHWLPFGDASLDVVILFEAIYYLRSPTQFLRECYRVLRPGGTLLLCSANKEWPGFNPSPFSKSYVSARELHQLLIGNNFEAESYGAFPFVPASWRERAVARIRGVAILLHLIPKTMKGKEKLKRLFHGKLITIEPEIDCQQLGQEPLHSLSVNGAKAPYKVLYAIGRR